MPPNCQSICGRVINIKTGAGEAGLTVSFGDPAWGIEEVTNADGEYTFGRMGSEAHLLKLVIPEGSALRSLATDIALAPPLGWATVVNLGVYEGAWAAPPVAPTVWAEPTWVRPGEQVNFTVRVENRLTTKISGVRVTDLLPEGLTLAMVTSDRGDANQTGNYGTAFIGDLGPGQVATVHLTADVAQDTAGTISNRVSLIYREHVATQAVVNVTVGGAAQPAATATEGEAASIAEPIANRSPTAEPSADEGTGSPTFLPVTGYGLTAIGAGLALGAVSLAARYIRKRREQDSSSEDGLPWSSC